MYQFFKLLIIAAAVCAAAFVSSCHRRTQTDPALEIRVYPEGNPGFGYALYQGTQKLIDQPNIPAIQGKAAFRSQEDAEKTAQLMKRKIQAHQFPPTVSIRELDSLGIHYQ